MLRRGAGGRAVVQVFPLNRPVPGCGPRPVLSGNRFSRVSIRHWGAGDGSRKVPGTGNWGRPRQGSGSALQVSAGTPWGNFRRSGLSKHVVPLQQSPIVERGPGCLSRVYYKGSGILSPPPQPSFRSLFLYLLFRLPASHAGFAGARRPPSRGGRCARNRGRKLTEGVDAGCRRVPPGAGRPWENASSSRMT